jgi:hypothetical protein
MGKVVLITGGRSFTLKNVINSMLYAIHDRHGIDALHEGGAEGADELGKLWALDNDVPVFTHEANWKLFGNRAGIMRNSQMLRDAKPDLGIAFPGGVGTADMTSKLLAEEVTTIVGRFSPGSFGQQVVWSVKNGNI